MADMTDVEGLPARVERIEQKLDALSDSVDKRFEEVSEHFVEQRDYTEFAFERLRKEMVERFTRVETLMATKSDIGRLERRLDGFEGKLDSIEGKFDEFLKSQSGGRRQRSRRTPKKR